MKKLLLILLFVVTAFTAKAQCNYTLEMTDAWGDGWDNGAGTGISTNSVDILVNGTIVLDDVYELGGGGGGTPTITSLNFLVNPGDDVTAVWTGGGAGTPNWENECSYRILDADGTEVAAVNPIVDGSGDILTGTITAACPACAAPNTLSVTAIGGTSATLNWVDGNAPSSFFNLVVNDVTGGTNFFTGVATNPWPLTGLTAGGNVYEFIVTADCGGIPSSSSTTVQWTQQDVPGCASNPSPTIGAIDVAPSATFTWDAPVTGGPPDGYNFYLGTASGALTNIGTVGGTTANITNLAVSTTYFWSIVPVNGSGEATGCAEWSFTIIDPPAGPTGITCPTGNNSNIFTESFDSVGGWTGDVTAAVANNLWVFGQTGSTATPNSGPTVGETGNYMYYEASGAAVNTASAVSPGIDLTSVPLADPAELSFYMHAFGTDMGTLNVGVGTSAAGPFTNEFSWSGQIQLASADAWHQAAINVSAYTGQTIFLEFSYTSTAGFNGDMSIDSLVLESCADICEDPTNLVANDFTITPSVDISWDAVATATSYTWEIQPFGTAQGAGIPLASGSGMAAISYDDVTGAFTDASQFSLFVRAVCPIGNSNYSQLDFTVVLPGTDYCGAYTNSPAAPINELAATVDVISATGSGFDTITDLDIAFDISHTFIGDLSIFLTSPSGTSVLLLSGPCGDFDDMNLRLDDEGGAGVCASPTIGTVTPANPLSAFDGEVFEGDWTLTIFDSFAGDDGILNSWCLLPTLAAPTTCTSGVTTTWNGIVSGWDNGTPTSIDNAILMDTYDTTFSGNIEACSLLVAGGNLFIYANEYARIQESIIVNSGAAISVLTDGSLLQVNDAASVAKSGDILVGISTPSLTARDFMIMGSPMTFEGPDAFIDNNGAGTAAYQVLNHTTANFTPYVGTPAVVGVNFHDQESDDWTNYAGLLFPGEGYLVRPSYVNSGAYNYTFTDGSLNNGAITYSAFFGDDKEDSPNVMSNPYASAINADLLIGDNSTIIDELYFWEHLTTPAVGIPGPLSQNFDMEDVSTRNLGMGLPAANDPGTSTTPDGIIATGQGFGIKAKIGGDVTFTNSMRLTTPGTLRSNANKDLLWIQVRENTYGMGSTAGIAFTENASEELDPGYDSMKLGTVVSLYSHLLDGSNELGIQSREAFETGITIPMGFSTLIEADAGIPYVISISNLEGANIENATVYLVDHLTNVTTNLSTDRYEFLSDAGTFNNRFTLVFETLLDIDNPALDTIVLYPNPTENIVRVASPNTNVTSIEVMDMMGRKVTDVVFSTEGNYSIDLSNLQVAVYFVTVNTVDGSITKRVTKK